MTCHILRYNAFSSLNPTYPFDYDLLLDLHRES
jgi:hypothetical protein